MNILVTRAGILRPLDFEGACPAHRLDPMPWGTPGFNPPELLDGRGQSGISGDRFALGALLYLLLTGRIPEPIGPVPLQELRQNVPLRIREIVWALLSPNPLQRPSTETVTTELSEVLSLLTEFRNAASRKMSRDLQRTRF
jgi:serine/threonine protein kinase